MFVEAEVWNVAHTDQGYAVLVRPVGTKSASPIFIGQLEAQSILVGMSGIPMPRPNTHDLMITALTETGWTIEKVEISELKEGIFFSSVKMTNGEQLLDLDSRPSDSIALAVRAGCPIYISEELIDETAVSLHFISDKLETSDSETENLKLELEKALDEAVKLEHYEDAAKIRDQIRKMDEDLF